MKLSLLFLFLFSFSLLSAIPNEADNSIDFTYETPINYSKIPTVNNSQYFQGYTPTTLGNWLQITFGWIANTVSDLTNYYNKTESDSKYVPYTGATSNVNLGSKNITATKYKFDDNNYFELGNWGNNYVSFIADNQESFRADYYGIMTSDGDSDFPSLSFFNDPYTGMFSKSEGILGISANSKEMLNLNGNNNYINFIGNTINGSGNINTTGRIYGGDYLLMESNNPAVIKVKSTNLTNSAGISTTSNSAESVGIGIISYGSNYSAGGSSFGLSKNNLSRIYSYGSPLAIGTWENYNLTLGTNNTKALVIDTSQNIYVNPDKKICLGNNCEVYMMYNSTSGYGELG